MAEQTKRVTPPTDDGFDMDEEIRRQAERVKNVQLKKDCSYYDHCKTMMGQIHSDYRLAFFCSAIICLIVSIAAVFKIRFQIFSVVAYQLGEPDNFITIFCGGFTQVFAAIVVLLIALASWAHLHRGHIFMLLFYGALAVLGIVKSDWPSVLLGAAGVIFYLRAVLAMAEDERMSELAGYPNFTRQLELSKEDFDHAPWHPDAPDRDKAYTEMLEKKAAPKTKAPAPAPAESPAPAPMPAPTNQKHIIDEIMSNLPDTADETEETPHADTTPEPPRAPVRKPQPQGKKKGKKHGKHK